MTIRAAAWIICCFMHASSTHFQQSRLFFCKFFSRQLTYWVNFTKYRNFVTPLFWCMRAGSSRAAVAVVMPPKAALHSHLPPLHCRGLIKIKVKSTNLVVLPSFVLRFYTLLASVRFCRSHQARCLLTRDKLSACQCSQMTAAAQVNLSCSGGRSLSMSTQRKKGVEK